LAKAAREADAFKIAVSRFGSHVASDQRQLSGALIRFAVGDRYPEN
jgi:hypothetical protein